MTYDQRVIFGFVVLAVLVVLTVLMWIFREKLRDNEKYNKYFRLVVIVFGISYLSYEPIKGFVVEHKLVLGSLPIQLCSLFTFAYIFAYFNPKYNVLIRGTFHFVVFATILAMLMPIGPNEINYYHYWNYYLGHIFLHIAYFNSLFVLQNKISCKDTLFGSFIMIAILYIVALPINLATGLTFMFIGPRTIERITELLVFGEWPTYLISFTITLTIFSVAMSGVTYLIDKYGPDLE